MKLILTENQVKRLIDELKLSGVVDDFLKDVKETKGALKYLSDEFPIKNTMESLEDYILGLDMIYFNELRDELKKFKQKNKK